MHSSEVEAFGAGDLMAVGRDSYGAWLLKLVAWDGILPLFVVLVPTAIELLVPKHRGAMEAAAVMLPIAAFFVRVAVGKRHIDSNRCAKAVRRFQFGALCVGILVLLLIDSLVILALEMPKMALFATDTDRLVWAVLIAIYLTSMAVAMYPGRTRPSPAEWHDFGFFAERGPAAEKPVA